MGLEQLLATLRRDQQDKVAELWRQAEEQAAELRRDGAAVKERHGRQCAERREAAFKKEREAILARAGRQARQERLQARQSLTDRLYRIAVEQLPFLRDNTYAEGFSRLGRELPAQSWGKVKVNPGDVGLGEALFPGVAVETDPAIRGGFIVMTVDERIWVDNTLERRLENGWQALLPKMIREVETGDGSS